MLSPQELNELLEIIDLNQSIFISESFGDEFLTEYDKQLLNENGIDVNSYLEENDPIKTNFHFGLLAQAFHDLSSLKKFTTDDLKKYIKEGQYVPLTEKDRSAIQSIKSQCLGSIRTLKGKIFEDVQNTLISKKSQEDFIRKEIESGIKKKSTIREIANDLSRKTGDWSRNFDRIVDYHMNSAYQEGRATMFEKQSGQKDPIVYKVVFGSACKHCLRLYTTKGFGSEPKLFKLSQLRANGDNISRKVDDWLPIIGSTHPHCRCLLMSKPENYSWNDKTKGYEVDVKITSKPINRKPIRIKVSGKEFEV